jgi:hypothetical protein
LPIKRRRKGLGLTGKTSLPQAEDSIGEGGHSPWGPFDEPNLRRWGETRAQTMVEES